MPRGTLITPLPPPTRGAFASTPSHLLPLDAVDGFYTQNVIIRDGQLYNRPGFSPLVIEATVAERPMGGIYYKDGLVTRTVIGTISNWYRFDGGAWVDITPGALTGTADDHVRFVVWPTGTTNDLVGVNGHHDVPQKWIGTGNATALGGNPPKAKDITIAANRVILARPLVGGIDQQYRIVWSDFNNHESYSIGSFVDLSDTYDPVVGVRSLTRTAFGIFKEDSQWIGFSQPGLFPFRFELQDTKPGPVSPAAIIVKHGRAYYLARDGSLYVFDGSRCEHIGEPIRPWIQRNINYDVIVRSFAFYLGRDRDLYWVFPQLASEDPFYAVSMNTDTGRFFPHVLRKPLTCGFEGAIQAVVSWDSMSGIWDDEPRSWDSFTGLSYPTAFVGAPDGKIHVFGIVATDDGLPPAARWRHGPRIPEGVQPSWRGRIQSVETMFRETTSTQPVTLRVMVSDTLSTLALTPPAGLTGTFDLQTPQAQTMKLDTDQAAAGFGEATPEVRFFAAQHDLDTNVEWAWQGGALRLYGQESD